MNALFLIFAGLCSGANIAITLLNGTATPTQATVSYCESGTATIALTASPTGQPTYTPNDVNGTLFTGANLDTRIPGA